MSIDPVGDLAIKQFFETEQKRLEEKRMSKIEIESDLVGEVCQVTMGLPTDSDWLVKRDPNNRYACWRMLGLAGIIRAVYLDKDREPCLLIKVPGEPLFECSAKHVTMVEDKI